LLPVNVELDYRRLPAGRPGAHPCGPFARTRFIDRDYQSISPAGFP
jgi:hypothetical protein